LSIELEDLLKKLLAKDPNKRYQEFKDVKKHKWLKDVDWDKV